MIIDPDLLGAVLAGGLNEEHISLVPITIIHLVEPVLAGVEDIFGVHDITENGIDRDTGGQVDYEHINELKRG